jgi:predicted nucleotidyltransferase
LSIRKIALLRKINYKSAYNAIKFLEKEGIIELRRAGNTLICKFNNKFNDLVFKAEYIRREVLFKDRNFLIIYNRLSELSFPFILLLFGSHAKGAATKHSDIDLLLISYEDNAKEIETQINLFPYKIHLTCVTYDDFIRMLKSKEFSVVSEAIKKNVLLVGIEEYYRILKNVR